jgi:hypothetical protein
LVACVGESGEVNDSFYHDLEWTQTARNAVLVPFYRDNSEGGRYVLIDKSHCSCILQKRLAVDTICQSKHGGAVCIEEKLTRYPNCGKPFPNFFLEIASCTVFGRESLGWMLYGQSDILLYGFQLAPDVMDFEAWLIPFPALREWFWQRSGSYRLFVMPHTLNHTAGLLVPIVDVQRQFKLRPIRLRSDELQAAA